MDKYRELYNTLLESDELYTMFSEFKGNWEEDSKTFIKIQKEMEDFVNFKDVIDAEDVD